MLKIKAVGDISFGDHPVCVGSGVASKVRDRGADFLFEHVKQLIAGSDVGLCNLEGVCSKVGHRPWLLRSAEMRGDPSSLSALRSAGFNMVTLANNHVLQHGIAPFDDMRGRLDELGVRSIGLQEKDGRTRPVVLSRDSVDFHFLAFSMHPEEHWSGNLPYAYRDSPESLLKEVREYRGRTSGPLIVSVHWGSEFLNFPSRWQVRLARELVDSGVCVVLGHHSHVVQHVERYGRGVVFYSLGNFIFDQWSLETRLSCIADIVISNEGVVDFSIIPIWINDDYQPVLGTGVEREQVEKATSSSVEELDSRLELLSDEDYRGLSRRRRIELRPQTYRRFLAGLPKCPPHLAVQSLARTAGRRLFGG